MNSNLPLLRPVRILLFPFSLIYGLILIVRNFLYNKKILTSTSFNLPVIGVGNLSVGGTGKSPMVEWILRHLKNDFKLAVLSRGYKRKTSGYSLAGPRTTALEIGDEPMQFHTKFPDVVVAVGEERVVAIPQLLHDKPDTQAIILDDAFQHRSVKAGLNILLSEYSNLFTRDWFLPTGDLRDQPGSFKRADLIIVTKSPADLSMEDQQAIREEISVKEHQDLYFTTFRYGNPYHIISRTEKELTPELEILLVTGIANPEPLKQYLADQCRAFYELSFSDHHIFRIDDLNDIKKKFEAITSQEKIILTTEKDAVRLIKFAEELKMLPMFVLPVEHHFLNGEAQSFLQKIINFIQTFKR